MAFLEIVMVITGLAAVFLSFRVSDKGSVEESGGNQDTGNLKSIQEEAQGVFASFDDDIKARAGEIIESTDDKLSKIMNEKIMGLSEYSGQLLDKMEKNHAETVFLYDMLIEKEKDIKALVHDIDVARADSRDEIAKQYQELKNKMEEAEELRKGLETREVKGSSPGAAKTVQNNNIPDNNVPAGNTVPDNNGIPDELLYVNNTNEKENLAYNNGVSGNAPAVAQDEIHTSMYDAEIARIEEQEHHEKSMRRLYGNMGVSGADAAAIEEGIGHVDHSSEIISLYEKGRSVLEISKMLEIGQGEVKFVIDMYKAS